MRGCLGRMRCCGIGRVGGCAFEGSWVEEEDSGKQGKEEVKGKGRVEELEEGVVRIYLKPNSNSTSNTEEQKHSTSSEEEEDEEEEEWSEHDVELRVLSDRRMQSAGGTGATYSSNMVPKDLVEFAKTSNSASAGGAAAGEGMGVDQIVKRWNAHVDADEKKERRAQ